MSDTPDTPLPAHEAAKEHGDLGDLLSELRVMLPGAQLLTAFLIVLPFNSGFEQIPSRKNTCFSPRFSWR